MTRKRTIIGLIASAAALVVVLAAVYTNYDIEYLLILQNFRNSTGNVLTPFMEWISHFAVNYLIAVPILIYWSIDKRNGLYIFAAMYASLLVNAFLKLTACIYRPWIRDARVIPAGNAIVEATGYSFPSGHTMCAIPQYGGAAVTYGKKYKWIGILCIIMIILTGFSRNYLGVHTPQDVLTGLFVSCWALYLMYGLFHYLNEHPEQEDKWLLGGVIASVIVLIYIFVKPYPADYINGKLLVDPKAMQIDSCKDAGTLGIFCIARYLEKRFVDFKPTGLTVKGIALSVIGLVAAFTMLRFLQPILVSLLGGPIGKLTATGLFILFVIALWPAVIRAVNIESEAETPNQ